MKSHLLINVSAPLVCWMLGALPAAAQLIAKIDPARRPQVMESYGKLPLSFEANQGQTDQSVEFLSRGSGYTLFLTEDSAVLSLHGKKSSAALRMKLLGANAHPTVTGKDALPGKSNYFTGTAPKQWRTNVPTYASVKYAGVYPGIDLVYHGNQRLLEYDFVVAPGADPRSINLRFQGAKKLSVNRDGALVLDIGGSEVIEHAPVVYQEIGTRRQTVAGRYVLRGRGQVGFSVPAYDRSRPLVIDPILMYSTYLGSLEPESGQPPSVDIAVDVSGNAYVTGATVSIPTTLGAFKTTPTGFWHTEAFVTKLNADGSAMVYSTYLGGSDDDWGTGIKVDGSGNAYVTGRTLSPDFPTTTGAFQTSYGAVFVAKLNATGSALLYSTYLGTSSTDGAAGLAVDLSGSAYVTGTVESYLAYCCYATQYTPGAFQTTLRGGRDIFIAKLNGAGSALIYSTYLGGSSDDYVYGIAVDTSGNAFVTGLTNSRDFPTTLGAFKTLWDGWGGFVTKLNTTGTALLYSTYLPSSSPSAIAVDASDDAYVTGSGGGYDFPNFPTTPGAIQGPSFGASVTKLNAAGSDLVYSTLLGYSKGTGIAVDRSGNAYVSGNVGPYFEFLPTIPGALKTTCPCNVAFVSKLNPAGSALLYSTMLGGNSVNGYETDEAYDIAIDASGNAYVTGLARSPDFPTTPGVFRTTGGGVFVTKLNLRPYVSTGPTTTAHPTGVAGTSGWYLAFVTMTLSATDSENPVSAIYYSLDGGPDMGYGAPFSIYGDGVHSLLFYSVDTTGHQETRHGQWIKIDSTKPVSRVATLPATAASPNFRVQWSGTDTTSGLASYSIFVSDNNGQFAPWLNQTTANEAWFTGTLGHTYRLYSSARDVAGNVEVKTVADAITFVPQMSADVNGDGRINCSDLAIVKASMGKSASQTGFDPRADVNHDSVVNVIDLAIVSQKLIPGTTCQ